MANAAAAENLDDVLFALADPTRRAIVEQLMHGPRRVGDLQLPRKISASTLSKHLSALMRCGLLTQRADGRSRVCKLNTARLRPMVQWVDGNRRHISSQRAALERYFGLDPTPAAAAS